jgi:hypothetical protein
LKAESDVDNLRTMIWNIFCLSALAGHVLGQLWQFMNPVAIEISELLFGGQDDLKGFRN